MHTHQSMVFAVGSLSEYQRLASDDVQLNLLPMAFDYGLYQLLLSVWAGATLILERSFTFPAEVFARMNRHGVTTFPGRTDRIRHDHCSAPAQPAAIPGGTARDQHGCGLAAGTYRDPAGKSSPTR
jgi:acyl-CoA synthetase (AMP-forming)/AMP-acid ligase II